MADSHWHLIGGDGGGLLVKVNDVLPHSAWWLEYLKRAVKPEP